MTIFGQPIGEVLFFLGVGFVGSLLAIPAWSGIFATIQRTTEVRQSRNKEREERIRGLARVMRADPWERLYLRDEARRAQRSARFGMFAAALAAFASPWWIFNSGGNMWVGLGMLGMGSIPALIALSEYAKSSERQEADKRVYLGLDDAEEEQLDAWAHLSDQERAELARARMDASQRELRRQLYAYFTSLTGEDDEPPPTCSH